MEAQRKPVQVAKGLQARLADRPLGDLGEHRVTQLPEDLSHHPGQAVGHQQGHRHHDQGGGLGGQRVDRVLVEHRHRDVGRLGGDQEEDGDDHPRPEPRLPARPQVGQQGAQRLEVVAWARVHGKRASPSHRSPPRWRPRRSIGWALNIGGPRPARHGGGARGAMRGLVDGFLSKSSHNGNRREFDCTASGSTHICSRKAAFGPERGPP